MAKDESNVADDSAAEEFQKSIDFGMKQEKGMHRLSGSGISHEVTNTH